MKSLKKTGLCMLLVALTACSEENTPIPKYQPKKPMTKAMGYHYPANVVASQEYEPFWVQYLANKYEKPSKINMPKEIRTVEGLAGCSFSRPDKGAYLVNVHIDDSRYEPSVYTYNNDAIKKSIKKLMEHYKATGETESFNYTHYRNLNVTDVFVTETSKPVHLVLAGLDKIWNIQAHENAAIKKVYVIGEGAAGVANLAEGTQIEFLNGKQLKKCGIVPTREPRDHWDLVTNKHYEYVEKHKGLYKVYDKWYRETFDAYTHENQIRAAATGHVLVGPFITDLKQRIPYKKLQDSTLIVSDQQTVVAMPKADMKKAYVDLVLKHTEKQLGTDISVLKPKTQGQGS